MINLYIDFDNTIVESNKRVIEILNDRYKINKFEDDLTDYEYKSIYPVEKNEIRDIYDSKDFFYNLDFQDGFIKFYNKYKNVFNIFIVTKGTPNNLEHKKNWIKNNIDEKVKVIGINSYNLSKNATTRIYH